MAFYSFKCKSCSKDLDVSCSPSNLVTITKTSGSLLDPCACGGELAREYGSIGLGPDIYKNDPNSNGYWKRGKSNGHIANILNDPKANPY